MSSLAAGFDTLARGAGGDPFGYQARLRQSQAEAQNAETVNAQAPQRAALLAEQTKNAQLINQERELALKDEQIQHDAMTQANGDPDQYVKLLAKNGARPATVFGAQQNLFTARKNALALSEDQRKDLEQRHEQYRGILEGVLAAPPDQKQAAWDDALQRGAAIDPQDVQGMPRQYPGDEVVTLHHNAIGMAGSILKEKNDRAAGAKSKAEADKDAAAAELDRAKTPGAIAEGQRQQLVTQSMQDALKDPTKGAAAIDAALPPSTDKDANAGYKAAWTAAMQSGSPEAAAKIVEAAAQHAASMSPAARQKKVDDAVAVERATTPLKIAQQVAAAKAMRAGDNPALSGVAPADIPRVNATAQKLDTDYIAAKTSAEDIQKLLDMAGSGNKAAGANVPLAGVGAINAVNGIKRINSAEIQQYGTAGSLLDKIQGKLQGWTEGQPIPKDVLADMKAMHEQLSRGAWDKYTTGLDSLNKRSGAKLAPTVEGPKSSAAAPQMVRARDPQGTLHEAPAGTPLPAGWKQEK